MNPSPFALARKRRSLGAGYRQNRYFVKLFSFLILFFLILSGASESAEPPSAEVPTAHVVKDNSKNQTQPIAPTEFEKTLIETLRAIANQQRTADEQNRADQKPWWIDYGLLGVAVVYTIFAGLQWWTIRGQAQVAADTLKAIDRQADVAAKTLNAIDRQAAAAERTLDAIEKQVIVASDNVSVAKAAAETASRQTEII